MSNITISWKNNIRSSFSLRATMLPNLKWTHFSLFSSHKSCAVSTYFAYNTITVPANSDSIATMTICIFACNLHCFMLTIMHIFRDDSFCWLGIAFALYRLTFHFISRCECVCVCLYLCHCCVLLCTIHYTSNARMRLKWLTFYIREQISVKSLTTALIAETR